MTESIIDEKSLEKKVEELEQKVAELTGLIKSQNYVIKQHHDLVTELAKKVLNGQAR